MAARVRAPRRRRADHPGARGGTWSDDGYHPWHSKVWKPTLEAGVPYQVPYDLRHSFA